MNNAPAVPLLRQPLLWAVPGGVLLALAFPGIGIAGLAWIAPGVILLAGLLRPESAFRTGYVAGLAHHLVSLHWLLHIPVKFFPILGWLALSGYLAFFMAGWVWLCVRLAGRGARPPLPGASPATPAVAGDRLMFPLLCAAAWVAMEMIVGRFLTGFPWNFLGTSQYRLLPLIQLASLTGVAGVSFLPVWFAVTLMHSAVTFFADGGKSSRWRFGIIAPALVGAGVVGWGMFRVMNTASAPARTLSVAMVQPNFPQTLIWDPAAGTNRFRRLLELTEQSLASPADLLLWPESALPGMLRYDQDVRDAVLDLVRRHRAWLITSGDDAEPKRGAADASAADYFNSAFLLSPEGKFVARYDKRRLVIFGEYVPLANALPFLKWFTPITGGFTAGTRAVPFELTAPRARTAVLICYEDMFAPLAREAATADTDFLVNLTNDGWFGEGAEQWQHAAGAVFRAVENGLPLVRACNNGITCWIDAHGRVNDIFADPKGGAHGEGFARVKIPLLPEGARRTPTFYHRFGDWFGWLCVAASSLPALKVVIRRRQN